MGVDWISSTLEAANVSLSSGWQFSPGEVIAFASMIIACCALALTFWQARASHKHNVLSVKPQCFSRVDRENGLVTISIVNGGLGPALISNFQIQFIRPGETERFAIDDLKAWPEMVQLEYVRHTIIGENGRLPIPAGEKHCVFEVMVPGGDKEAEEKALKITEPLDLHVYSKYNDMYGNKYPVTSKKSD